MKKSNIGALGFIMANISFLCIFYTHGINRIIQILITIIGIVLFVCLIDKDVVPAGKHK